MTAVQLRYFGRGPSYTAVRGTPKYQQSDVSNQIHLIRWIDYSDGGTTVGFGSPQNSSATPQLLPFGPQSTTTPEGNQLEPRMGSWERRLLLLIRSIACRLRSIAYSRQFERCDFCAASAAWGVQGKGGKPALEAQPLAPECAFCLAFYSIRSRDGALVGPAINGLGARYESAPEREAEAEEGSPCGR
jgi:hypothetical protein